MHTMKIVSVQIIRLPLPQESRFHTSSNQAESPPHQHLRPFPTPPPTLPSLLSFLANPTNPGPHNLLSSLFLLADFA